jgi:hypothetical protein
MRRLKRIAQWQTVSGSPVTAGDVTVTPQSQSLTVRWPYGGWVWNRPVAILVERGGQTERVPIVDVTRAVQLGLLCCTLVFGMVTVALTARRRRNRNE